MRNWETVSFHDDLNVFYNNYQTIFEIQDGGGVANYKSFNNLYVLLYIKNGESEIKVGNFSGIVKKNSLVVVKIQEFFKYVFRWKKPFEYLLIDIHPSVFKKQIGDKYFARAFDYFKNDRAIIDLNSSEFALTKQLLDSVAVATKTSQGRCHIEAKVLSIISELCVISDPYQQPLDTKPTKDNIPVLILEYIRTHYTEKITYELLAEKFYTSISTVSVIIKNFTGKTLKEYVTLLRMRDAKNMISQGLLPINKIAELCGYKEYSAFYRAYQKYYGVLPKEDKSHMKRWPLSK